MKSALYAMWGNVASWTTKFGWSLPPNTGNANHSGGRFTNFAVGKTMDLFTLGCMGVSIGVRGKISRGVGNVDNLPIHDRFLTMQCKLICTTLFPF